MHTIRVIQTLIIIGQEFTGHTHSQQRKFTWSLVNQNNKENLEVLVTRLSLLHGKKVPHDKLI